VPLLYLADALDAQTGWNSDEHSITISQGNTDLKFIVNSTTYTINGTEQQIIKAGRVYLPAAFVAEAFDYTAAWDSATERVVIVSLTNGCVPQLLSSSWQRPALF
jgi:hypothetical protein